MQRKRVVLHLYFMAKHSFIKTVAKLYFAVAKNAFICTSADELVSVVIYNLFLSPVISRFIENNS